MKDKSCSPENYIEITVAPYHDRRGSGNGISNS